MDRGQGRVNELDADRGNRYWNPPPPPLIGSIGSMLSPSDTNASNVSDTSTELMVVVKQESGAEPVGGPFLPVANLKREIIDLVDSEDEDGSVVAKQPCLALQIRDQQQLQQDLLEPVVNETSNPPQEETAYRLLKYETRFAKLRYMYDKLKTAHAESKKERETLSGEVKRMKEKARRESTEVTRLRVEIGEKNQQLNVAEGRIGVMEKEMENMQARQPNAENLVLRNQSLARRVIMLEGALKAAYTDQMSALNYHKHLVEKSNERYEQLFGGNKGGTQQQQSGTSCGNTTVSKTDPSQWPFDPRYRSPPDNND